jgi:hypothetical protein
MERWWPRCEFTLVFCAFDWRCTPFSVNSELSAQIVPLVNIEFILKWLWLRVLFCWTVCIYNLFIERNSNNVLRSCVLHANTPSAPLLLTGFIFLFTSHYVWEFSCLFHLLNVAHFSYIIFLSRKWMSFFPLKLQQSSWSTWNCVHSLSLNTKLATCIISLNVQVAACVCVWITEGRYAADRAYLYFVMQVDVFIGYLSLKTEGRGTEGKWGEKQERLHLTRKKQSLVTVRIMRNT